MALVDLGIQQISADYMWVSYSPVPLRSGRLFFLEINYSTNSPDLVYSDFRFRLFGTKVTTGVAVTEPTKNTPLDAQTSVIAIPYYSYFSSNQDVVVQCQRVPFFSQQSGLADVSVQVLIDPTESERL